MNILVTGATGFVGNALCAQLVNSGYTVRALIRGETPTLKNVEFVVGALDDEAALASALTGIDCVVHLAGRAHQLNDVATAPLVAFRAVNRDGTLLLANCAKAARVKRFVFISSIGVNGAATTDLPFTELAPLTPHADYAISKLEAEEGLLTLMADNFEVVIVRPPLVYAAHAPGNFARLLKLVSLGIPVPFGSVKNQRSMIALENLVEFIRLCITHPAAANELFLISDGLAVSTADIFRYLAHGMEKRLILLPFPLAAMKMGARLLSKEALYTQLCGSLVVDCSKAMDLLQWKPVVSPEHALVNAGKLYKQQKVEMS
ncbi:MULTISPECIES: NAD-dependent epimerase/dehydratase family protein [unclassified Pseudomonas]|uniref:NAD-dependent epimerase/dehydratase family protein n=1 Tax=unclassified Pseudomonas TaxID=196821 RepID=UPI0030DB75C0